jgi:hypothetical protein
MLQLSKEQLLKEHFSPTRDRSLFTYKVLMVLIRLCSNKSLMGLGYAGDSFNDVISKLRRIQRSYQEKQQQPQMQQQESDDENNSTNSSGLPFPGSLSELFNEQDSQQLADLLGWRIFSSSIRTASWCTAGGGGATHKETGRIERKYN